MAIRLCIILLMAVTSQAAPPAGPRYLPQAARAQNLQPIEYFNNHPEVARYYEEMAEEQMHQRESEIRQIQEEVSERQRLQQRQRDSREQAARLENLENPDSEVELIPGAQQPQQPPQQAPVNPNAPGLLPGQRVFIVHMPVPGVRPGTIGGYQPVYIVAAGPQGNPQIAQGNPQVQGPQVQVPQGNPAQAGYPPNGYAANGYQNAVLLNPQGQVLSPFFGYPGAGGLPGQQSGLLVGGPGGFNQFRGFGGYPDQFAYQYPQGSGPQGQQSQAIQGPAAPLQGPGHQPPQGLQAYRSPQGPEFRPVQFSPYLNLQGQQQLYPQNPQLLNLQQHPQLLNLQQQNPQLLNLQHHQQQQLLNFYGYGQQQHLQNLGGQPSNAPRNAGGNATFNQEAASTTDPKRVGADSKEDSKERLRNAKPSPPIAQANRNKA